MLSGVGRSRSRLWPLTPPLLAFPCPGRGLSAVDGIPISFPDHPSRIHHARTARS